MVELLNEDEELRDQVEEFEASVTISNQDQKQSRRRIANNHKIRIKSQRKEARTMAKNAKEAL